MRLAVLLATVTVLAGATLLHADTYPRQPGVDAIHYRFALTVSDTSASISGEATATFRVIAPVAAIELDLMEAMRVESVSAGDASINFTHTANRLRLATPPGIGPGGDVTYTIRYSGTPTDGLQVFTNLHGERVMFSEGWPDRARHWLPMIDHPYDKATGEMIIDAPSRWQVVSNGLLVEEVDVADGRRRTHWRQAVPIASWLYAVGIGRFDAHHAGSVRGIPLQTWSFPQDRVAARGLFEETSRQAIEFFSDRIGSYPYEKLANVQASGFGGGMENATVIFYGEKGVASGRGPVVHEVAHQWWGNSVTQTDWDDVWLSEGFASYFTHLFREHSEGREAFTQGLARSRAGVLENTKTLPDTPVVHPDLDNMARLLNALVYEKGAWVLHMLRVEVGVETFWRGIREYYRRYRDRNASTDDFRQIMEQVSGRDLGWFFMQWLHRGGHPAIDVAWRYDRARGGVELDIRQTQPGEAYRLQLDVELNLAQAWRRHQVTLDSTTQIMFVATDGEVRELRLDPETSLLAEMQVRRTPQ